MSQQSRLTGAEARTRLDEGLAKVDGMRVEALQRAERIQNVRAAGAGREATRLAAKYGETHPRALAARARAGQETRFARVVGEWGAISREETPKVDAKSWAVHGRVVRSNGDPVPGVTLSLFDAAGAWDRAFGHACTTATGYFKLAGLVAANGTQRFLVVSGKDGRPVHREAQPLILQGGTVATRLVVLPDLAANAACPPPVGGTQTPLQQEPGEQDETKPVDDPTKPRGRAGEWTVRGRVTDEEGEPVKGAIVSLFDADLFFDDRLGETTTGDDGEYELRYRAGDFRDLVERRPDLFVKVMDRDRRTVFSTHADLRFEAGRAEVLDIRLRGES